MFTKLFHKQSIVALLLLACCALGAHPAFAQREATAARELAGATLLQELRKGGYVLYFRHSSTDFSRNDDNMTSFDDCATQRNLTDAGRAQARAIGERIRTLGIPVGKVLASPYCRTVETAMLIFGRAEKSRDVRGGPASADKPERYAALRGLFSTRVPAGTNLAIASHGNPFHAVAGPPYLAEGEAAVVLPQGTGFAVVARLRPDQWDELRPAH